MALPGISGGTMAFVMGIYEKLIFEISKLKARHFKIFVSRLSLKKSALRQSALFFAGTWDWAFLIPLIGGLAFSAILFVAFAPGFIERYALPFYSLVFGLALASVFKPFKEMKKTLKALALLVLSFALNLLVFSLGGGLFSLAGGLSPWIFLPAGFLVSMALIVPGISGSYLLAVFGLYEKTLLSLKEGNLAIISCFFIGAAMGLFSTAKAIHYAFKNYFNEAMAIIIGLILASLYAIYPLPKESLADILDFNPQKKIFLFCAIISFAPFTALSLSFRQTKSAGKSP